MGINARLASIVWLEQVSKGVFEQHTIESGTPNHATLDAADLDGDGRPDLVVGWFAFKRPTDAWIDVWRNGGKRETATHGAVSRIVSARVNCVLRVMTASLVDSTPTRTS